MTIREVRRPEKPTLRTDAVGEVRTKVRLVNAVDEELARQGKITAEQMRTYEADALVDTGAVRSVIPVNVVQLLGVTIRERVIAEYADGRKDEVGLTGPVMFQIMGRNTMEDALVLGDEVLVGQTILEKLDLFPDCANRRLIPNPAHPDQPVSKVK